MENLGKIKYFIYARKSSESEDRQMASIESQIDELKKLAEQEGLEVVDVLFESKSAKEPGRPVFNKMLERILKGEAGGIICWKLNRLARNPIDGGQISWLLQQSLIKHILTYGRSYYPSDNVLMMAVELGMANQFIRDLSTDTKRGLKSKAERGWYPTYTTLGYIHNPLKKKGDREILNDLERYDLVRKIFETMLTGQYNPIQVLKMANEDWGLRTKAGRKVARSTIYRILSDPFYYGEYEFPKESGNWYQGNHNPMITKADFEKIQKIMGKGNKTHAGKHDFPFRGPIHCSECGALITAEPKVKRQKNGNVHFYTYYHCTKRKNPNCSQKGIEEAELEVQIIDVLKQIEIPESFHRWAIENLKIVAKEESKDRNLIIGNQRKEYDKVVQMLDNLISMRANGEISELEFKSKKSNLLEEKDGLEKILNGTEERITDWMNMAEKYFEFAEKARSSFETGTLEVKKSILYGLGSNLYLKDKKLSVSLAEPLFVIKSIAKEARDINAMFEPLNTVEKQGQLSDYYSQSPKMLPLYDEIRTHFEQNPDVE
ncbi:MAG: resolvase domain-containing protein [Candidatus Nomurabacteria bacterium GW2011_GWA2_42_41]|nr:MAG: resolvase domain-containing protein [Candidatus Nomurabacteria bacterium GW2011_GWA2_42_41]